MLKESSSFRDPSGFVFRYQAQLYRSVNKAYAKEYKHLSESGLAEALFNRELLIHHEQVALPGFDHPELFVVLKPEKLDVISYPYEWSFSQLKAAALLTLDVMKVALDHGMILKDASGYNVQFKGYKPIFIDSLSFAIYEEGQLWQGYRQFCEHFLAPLCLGSFLGVNFQSLLRLGVDGIPLKMASRILPWYTWLKPAPLMHIHLHAGAIDKNSQKPKSGSARAKISRTNLDAMISHLHNYISHLQLNKSDKTQWQDYDQQTHYDQESRASKMSIVREFVERVNPSVVWDIGANDGFFSRSITGNNRSILSLDFDPLAIEKNFLQSCQNKEVDIFPLLFDLANPTPAMGWANKERPELAVRSKPDLILALALIHHITITNNVPFEKVSQYFAGISEWLIIEFVPTDDEKIKPLPETGGKLLYNRQNFERGFFEEFELVTEKKIARSERSLLLLKRIGA